MCLANKNKFLFFLLYSFKFLTKIEKNGYSSTKSTTITNTHIGKSHQYPYPYTLPANCYETLNCRWNLKYIPNENFSLQGGPSLWAKLPGWAQLIIPLVAAGYRMKSGAPVAQSASTRYLYRMKSLRYLRLWTQDGYYYGQQLSLQTLNPPLLRIVIPHHGWNPLTPALKEQS